MLLFHQMFSSLPFSSLLFSTGDSALLTPLTLMTIKFNFPIQLTDDVFTYFIIDIVNVRNRNMFVLCYWWFLLDRNIMWVKYSLNMIFICIAWKISYRYSIVRFFSSLNCGVNPLFSFTSIGIQYFSVWFMVDTTISPSLA